MRHGRVVRCKLVMAPGLCGSNASAVAPFLLALSMTAAPARAVSAQPLGAELRVNTYTTYSQGSPSVAMAPNGSFVIAWRSQYGDSFFGFHDEVFAQRFDAAGVPQGAEFRVHTYTTNDQFDPSVAMDANGNFVVAWTSNRDGIYGLDTGIFAQRFDAAGVPQGGEFQVNTFTPGWQLRPSVGMDAGGNFVVAWMGTGQDGSGYGIFARRFDAAGVPQGLEFQVNTYTTDNQTDPSAAMDAGGNFVIAWERLGQDGAWTDISAQRFDAFGVAQGAEFQVNTFTPENQRHPSVAMDASGSFVVAWDANNQGGSQADVFAQRFDASGVPQGSEFQVNTFTPNTQSYPAVSIDPNGGFVVAWHSDLQDGSRYGIFAQRFDAAGARVGGEFQVNTSNAQDQVEPSLAMDGLGRFVVAWRGESPPGIDIFAQRFDLAQSLSIGDVLVTEGASGTTQASFAVTLSPPSSKTVTVDYTTADGTALAGSDYLPASGTLTFEPGATMTTIAVTVSGDVADEPAASGPSEFFLVSLSAAANARLSDSLGQATILNDDAAPGGPLLDPVPDGVITVGGTTTLTGVNFTAGTVIKLFVNMGDSIDDVALDGYMPTAFTANTLTWDIPATIALGQGFGSIFVVNTDQCTGTPPDVVTCPTSNTQYALLHGDEADNLPTITAIAGTPLSTTLEAGVPVAHADTVVTPGATVTITGTGFNTPGMNLFAASQDGADPAPTPYPCGVTNYGGSFLLGTSTGVQFTIPADVPAGPANFQAVNSPFTGNVESNSVSAVMGARATITSVVVSGSEVQVFGTGFSCLSVINLFNLQGATVVNLGGLTGGGQRVIPLQFISSTELRFERPAGAIAGPAFVEVLNPPYIPFSSSGNDPDGAFSFP